MKHVLSTWNCPASCLRSWLLTLQPSCMLQLLGVAASLRLCGPHSQPKNGLAAGCCVLCWLLAKMLGGRSKGASSGPEAAGYHTSFW